MEVYTPLIEKGSSPAQCISKMNAIISNHQSIIDEILQALLTFDPQNSQFTNLITKIQKDYKKSIEENNFTENSVKVINASIINFVETTETNISSFRIDVDQLSKQTNENSEVLTTIGANLQSLRDDFELFRMKRTSSLSPRKKNDQVDIEKVKSDVNSLKNALEVVNENYAPLESFENSLNEIKKLKDITQKFEDAKYEEQLQNLSKSQQDLIQKEANQSQQISHLENTQNLQDSQLQKSIQQINHLKSQLDDLKNLQVKADQSVNAINSNLEEQQTKYLHPMMDQVSKIEEQLKVLKKLHDKDQNANPQINIIDRDQILNTLDSDFGSINKRLDEFTNSQNRTNEDLNTLNSKLSDRIAKAEDKLNELNTLQERINNIENNSIDKESIPEKSDIISMKEQLNEVITSQSKTIETVNVLKAKLEEQQAQFSQPLIDQVNKFEKQLNELENIKNSRQQNNGLGKDEILQIPEISDIISMKELLNEVVASQEKTIETVDTLKSKLEEHHNNYSLPLTDQINKLEKQLNQLEITTVSTNNDNKISILEEKVNSLENEIANHENDVLSSIKERLNELENSIQQKDGLNKEEILQIPEISDVMSMKEIFNEVVASQTKTIETVNALKSKLEEHYNNYSLPLADQVNKIEEQLNQLEIPATNSNEDEYRISLLEEKINSLENEIANNENEDLSTIKERLNELTISQNKAIETVNTLTSRLAEQQIKFSNPLLDRVNQIEEQLNQDIPNIQKREIKIEDYQNLAELQQNVELLSSKQQEEALDLKSHKNRLNKLDDNYSSLQSQMKEIKSKLISLESEKQNKKDDFQFPPFSDDEDENDDGSDNSKLRKRISRLEKIIAHLIPAQELNNKMIPIDFDDEIDLENETTDETLRRHNREISVLAKDLIVLSNEVIDIQGNLNELKLNDTETPVKSRSINKELLDNPNDKEEEEGALNSKGGKLANNEDLLVLKDRVEEISCYYTRLQEMNKQIIPYIRQHQSDINLLSEKQKSLEDQFEQFEQNHDQIDENRRLFDELQNYQQQEQQQRQQEQKLQQKISIDPNLAEDFAHLKKRVDEISSAFITIRNLNGALIDHARKNESDISQLLAKQSRMEEQICQSEHEREHEHGKHVKRVKKYKRRSRRRQYEEEDENDDEQSADVNENRNATKSIDNIKENQIFSEEVINRINVLSSNNAKLFDVCRALKSYLIQQQEEIERIPKLTTDVRCIKHELRKLLEDKDRRPYSQYDDEKLNDIEELANVPKLTTEIRCIKHELKKLLKSKNNGYYENENEDLNDIKISLSTIADSQKEVINTASAQTQAIKKQKDQINSQLAAVRELNQRIADQKEQLASIQSDLSSIRGEIENLKDDQNVLKKSLQDSEKDSPKERSIDLSPSKPSPEILESIEKLNDRMDALEEKAVISEETGKTQQAMREVLSKMKILVDSSNAQTSYIKSQQKAINEMNTTFGDKTNDFDTRLEKLEYSMKCIKYEMRKIKFEPRSYSQLSGSDQVIDNGQLNLIQEAMQQIADKMESLIENSNTHSQRIQKQQQQINKHTAAIHAIVKNKDQYNLNNYLDDDTSSQEICQIRREIEQIKCTLRNNNNDGFNDSTYQNTGEDLQNLKRKVQQQDDLIDRLRNSNHYSNEDPRIDQIIYHLNKLESSQRIIIQNANNQTNHINSQRNQLSQIETKIDNLDKRLDNIDLAELGIFDSDNNRIEINNLSQKIESLQTEMANNFDDLNQKLNTLQDIPRLADNGNQSSDIQESIQSLENWIQTIERKLQNNFVKITEAHQKIVNRFDKVSKDIKMLKERNNEIISNIQNENSPVQERSIPFNDKNVNSDDINNFVSEFDQYKKHQEDRYNNLKRVIEESNQNTSVQIQNAINLVRNELNQRSSKNHNQNQNPNVQSDLFSLKKEFDTLKVQDLRKELSSLKSEQKRILSLLSKSGLSSSNDDKSRIEAITTKINQMKVVLNDLSSKIQLNDQFMKNELPGKFEQLTSNAEEIDKVNKMANMIVKIVKGHGEKLNKLKDHNDYQDGILSEISGREIRMMSSRPTTPK